MIIYIKGWLFNRQAARRSPDLVLKNLDVQRGSVVADIGAGGGFYSYEFSRIVGPKGRVFSVDVDHVAVNYIKKKAEKMGIKNIETVRSDGSSPNLKDGSVDLVFMRNVTHHVKDPVRFFTDLRRKLRSGGRVAIIDYRGEKRSIEGMFDHRITEGDLTEWMVSAGYSKSGSFDLFGDEFFLIFS